MSFRIDELPTDTAIRAQLEAVIEAERAAKTSQDVLKQLRRNCGHRFKTLAQGFELPGGQDGVLQFFREHICTSCGLQEIIWPGTPLCLTCNQPLMSADERDVKEHFAEFQATLDNEENMDRGGNPLGGGVEPYRCLCCGRPHAYCLPGD